MEMFIIEKQALDELIYRFELLKTKFDSLYANSGIAPQKWLDTEQVCFRLSACKRTVHSLRDSGILPYTKIGAKVFFKPEDVEKLLLIGYQSITN